MGLTGGTATNVVGKASEQYSSLKPTCINARKWDDWSAITQPALHGSEPHYNQVALLYSTWKAICSERTHLDFLSAESSCLDEVWLDNWMSLFCSIKTSFWYILSSVLWFVTTKVAKKR